MGRFAFLSAGPARGIYTIRVRSDTMYATERGGGKVKSKSKECCPAGDRARGIVCEGGSGIQSESARSKGAAVVEVRWQRGREGS